MKLIFAGTPEFAAEALTAILAAGHEVALVLTQPDRPAGRGMVMHASPVKRLALAHGIPVFQPTTLKDATAQDMIRAGCRSHGGGRLWAHPAAGSAGYAALRLPQHPWVTVATLAGCSTDPARPACRRYGNRCLHHADGSGAGYRAGIVFGSGRHSAGDTAGYLHDRLAALGGRLIVAALARLPLSAQKQPEIGVTYAAKIDKAESLIDWAGSAAEIDRHIRAFNPFPGASTALGGLTVKIWAAAAPIVDVSQSGAAGEVLAVNREGILIACGRGAMLVRELQKAGGKRLSAAQFLAGTAIAPGTRFCSVT